MRGFIARFAAVAALASVAACGTGGTGATSTPTPSLPLPSFSPTPSPSPSPGVSDPCQLVTMTEASALAGVTFPAGVEGSTGTGSNTCTYGGQTKNVFLVLIAKAADAATASAQWDAQLAKAQAYLQTQLPPGAAVQFNTSDVSILGADKAAAGTGSANISGVTLSATDVFLLKGATFVFFSDLKLGDTPPSLPSMENQGTLVVSRL